MGSSKAVAAEALGLPREARADLARQLIESLDDPADAGAEEAWLDEIERRHREVEAGTAKLVPWQTVRATIEARLRRAGQ